MRRWPAQSSGVQVATERHTIRPQFVTPACLPEGMNDRPHCSQCWR